MALSRKHFEKFAAMLAGERALAEHSQDEYRIRTVANITRSMGDIFAQDNSAFNRSKFYDAAGHAE